MSRKLRSSFLEWLGYLGASGPERSRPLQLEQAANCPPKKWRSRVRTTTIDRTPL